LPTTATGRSESRRRPRRSQSAEVATGDSAFFARETANNLIDINLTNYGFFGNNFQSSKSSFVYPRARP
jgi:hypothetical protein